MSIVLGERQNFIPLDRRETSALLHLRWDELKTLSDTKYPFRLPFSNSATLQIGSSDAISMKVLLSSSSSSSLSEHVFKLNWSSSS